MKKESNKPQTGVGIDLNFDDITQPHPTFKEAADAALAGRNISKRNVKLKTVSIQVQPEIRDALRKIHSETGVGIQFFVEKALREALREQGYWSENSI